MSVITLPHNTARVEADQAEYAAFKAKPLEERAALRKEIAASEGDADFTRVSLSEGRFIDLAIHKNTFLDDAAIRTDILAETPIAWKSRYEPVVGVTTGSVYGAAPRHLYQTQDNAQFISPFVIDVPEVQVPTMAVTQDPAKLGQRQAALERQAEAARLKMETFLVNFMTSQPLGTDLATSISNYRVAGNPYTSKTVYVVDPGVQAGTYETSNIIDASAEAGLSPGVFELLLTQELLSGRKARTIHIPVAGLPWRKLIRFATVVANQSAFTTAGSDTNTRLNSVPAATWEKMWKTDMEEAIHGGLTMDIFGRQYKIKANNALPQGLCVVTTDEPAAEVFNITDRRVSADIEDPRQPFFVGHYEKFEMAIAVPDPWVRNWFLLDIGATSL